MKKAITILTICLFAMATKAQIANQHTERRKPGSISNFVKEIDKAAVLATSEKLKDAEDKFEVEKKYLSANKALLGKSIAQGIHETNFIYELKDKTDAKYAYTTWDYRAVIPLAFEQVVNLNQRSGMAKFKIDGKWGIIQVKDLKVLFEPVYDKIEYKNATLIHGLFATKNGRSVYLTSEGEEMPYMIIDDSGTKRIRRITDGTKIGLIDEKGNIISQPRFDIVLPFSDGLAYVSLKDKKGYIDAAGKMVLETNHGGYFSEGLLAIETDDKYGFMNKTGKIVIPCIYEKADKFHESLAAVKKGGKWGFIDKNNKIIVPIEYDKAGYFSEGLAGVKKGGKWGFVDKNNKVAVPVKYDEVSDFSEGLVAAVLYNKMGYVNQKGAVVIPFEYEPNYYDENINFSNGEAWVCKTNEGGSEQWGKINKSGKLVIPISYPFPLSILDNTTDKNHQIVRYSNDLYDVRKKPFEIKKLSYSIVRRPFVGHLTYTRYSNGRGIINDNLEEILPAKYDAVGDLSEKLIWVKKGGVYGDYGLIDKTGKIVMEANHFYISPFVFEGKAIVIDKDFKIYYIDKAGNKVK